MSQVAYLCWTWQGISEHTINRGPESGEFILQCPLVLRIQYPYGVAHKHTTGQIVERRGASTQVIAGESQKAPRNRPLYLDRGRRGKKNAEALFSGIGSRRSTHDNTT